MDGKLIDSSVRFRRIDYFYAIGIISIVCHGSSTKCWNLQSDHIVRLLSAREPTTTKDIDR